MIVEAPNLFFPLKHPKLTFYVSHKTNYGLFHNLKRSYEKDFKSENVHGKQIVLILIIKVSPPKWMISGFLFANKPIAWIMSYIALHGLRPQ